MPLLLLARRPACYKTITTGMSTVQATRICYHQLKIKLTIKLQTKTKTK